jgi:hypothetical protein
MLCTALPFTLHVPGLTPTVVLQNERMISNPDNALRVKPWTGDLSDKQLIELAEFLDCMWPLRSAFVEVKAVLMVVVVERRCEEVQHSGRA